MGGFWAELRAQGAREKKRLLLYNRPAASAETRFCSLRSTLIDLDSQELDVSLVLEICRQ